MWCSWRIRPLPAQEIWIIEDQMLSELLFKNFYHWWTIDHVFFASLARQFTTSQTLVNELTASFPYLFHVSSEFGLPLRSLFTRTSQRWLRQTWFRCGSGANDLLRQLDDLQMVVCHVLGVLPHGERLVFLEDSLDAFDQVYSGSAVTWQRQVECPRWGGVGVCVLLALIYCYGLCCSMSTFF